MKTIFAVLVALVPSFVAASSSSNFVIKPLAKTEKRQLIVVLDTGVTLNRFTSRYLCDGGHVDVTGQGLNDVNGHGTHIAGIIANAIDTKKQCLVIVKWYHNKTVSGVARRAVDSEILALKAINKMKPKLVNMSLSGWVYSKDEAREIKDLLGSGATVVVSSGNDRQNLGVKCQAFPACSFVKKTIQLSKTERSRYFVVASGTKDSFSYASNFGGPVTSVEYGEQVVSWGTTVDELGIVTARMTGTSQAAAIFSGAEAQLLLGLGKK